jgi:hypothetical protein
LRVIGEGSWTRACVVFSADEGAGFHPAISPDA